VYSEQQGVAMQDIKDFVLGVTTSGSLVVLVALFKNI
jgi:hypothetical protein